MSGKRLPQQGSGRSVFGRGPVLVLLVFSALIAYGGYLGYRASKDVVTLNVRNAELAKVVRAIRWQTWESVYLDKNATGTVTLDVENMPLDKVLQLVTEQTQSRWTKIYPLYLRKASLASLQRALRGEIPVSQSGFTNLQSRGFGMRGGPQAFGDFRGDTNQGGLVSLVLSNKDLIISARALSRSGNAQVIPENGIQPKLNLELREVAFEEAVDQVATQARRSWTKFYAIQANTNGPGGREMFAQRGAPPTGEMSERRNARNQAMLDTLTPEERAKEELRQQERQAMASLTPEQREQVMAERANNPEMQQRSEQRAVANLRNSTPEQRRDNYQRMAQMRKARAAAQASRK